MKTKYLIKLGLKNLLSNRLRTMLTLSGVVIGVASIIFLVSLGFGLQNLVTSEVATMDEMEMVAITPGDSEIIMLDDGNIEKIESISGVEKVGKVINVAARINYQKSAVDSVAYGVDENYIELNDITVKQGRMFSSPEAQEVVINNAMVELLGEDVSKMIGKKLNFDFIITSDLLDSDGKKIIKKQELEVVGIKDNDGSSMVYLPEKILIENGTKYYSSIKAKMANRSKLDGIRETIENMGFKTEYVGDTITQIDQIFAIFKIVLGGFGAIAMAVAALGMLNTLTVSLLERIREIGLMKALGIVDRDIRKLFLFEALIIGVSGGFIGMIFGYITGVLLNIIINIAASASGAGAVDLFYTPWYFAVGIALFSIIVGLITGLYPAKRAVKINALDALRYE